jgi:hypothetical protein
MSIPGTNTVKAFYDRYWPLLLIASPFVLLMLGPPLLVIGSSWASSFGEYLHRVPFDSARWQDRTLVKAPDPIRTRMVDDLLAEHAFSGVPREAVVRLLGEPDQTEYFRDWDMVYWLGPERGFISIDSEWLVFRLGDRQHVTEYRLVRD